MKGGLLSLNRVNSHIIEKVPCLVCHPGTGIDLKTGCFYGDSGKEVFTGGILMSECKTVAVTDGVMKDHLGGGIIANLQKDCTFKLFSNRIFTGETVGIYVQGEETQPVIEGNEIK